MKIEKINDLQGHEGAIYALEESFEQGKCYSAGFDNILVEWDLISKTPPKAIAKLPSKAFSILKIESLNLILVGTAQGGVHVIDINTKKELVFLLAQTNMIFDLVYDKIENQLIVVSADGSITIWDCLNWSLKKYKQIADKKLRCCIQFNTKFLVGCEDGSIRILNSFFNEIDQVKTHNVGFGVNTLSLSPCKQFLLSGSRDGHLNIHDVNASFILIRRIPAHNFAIYDIKYSPSKNLFVTVSRDKSFKVWTANTFKVLAKIDFKKKGHKASVNSVLWTKFNLIVTTGDDRSIKVWKVSI